MFSLATRKPNTPPRRPQGPGQKPPQGGGNWRFNNTFGKGSFIGNLILTILIFLFLMSGYSLFAGLFTETPTISLSEVASDVAAGKVQSINVSGDALDVTYIDGAHKSSQKDPASGLPETLATYGITPAQLSQIPITIKGQSG